MNTYQLQRKILSAPGLNMTEKFIGMTYALHLNIKTGTIRVKQATIAKECGCTDRTVRNAVSQLVKAGIFESVRTGRSAVLRIPCKNNCNITSGSCVPVRPEATFLSGGNNPLKLQDAKVTNPNAMMPWEYDPKLTSHGEEADKRGIW